MESHGSFLNDISCVACIVCEACSTLDQRGKDIFHLMSNVHHITESAVSFLSFYFLRYFYNLSSTRGRWKMKHYLN